MGLNKNKKLIFIANILCRELRKNATHSEKIIWDVVRNRKLNGRKINRQYAIFYDLDGIEKFFIADFYCHETKLVVEIDGAYNERQKEYDHLTLQRHIKSFIVVWHDIICYISANKKRS